MSNLSFNPYYSFVHSSALCHQMSLAQKLFEQRQYHRILLGTSETATGVIRDLSTVGSVKAADLG